MISKVVSTLLLGGEVRGLMLLVVSTLFLTLRGEEARGLVLLVASTLLLKIKAIRIPFFNQGHIFCARSIATKTCAMLRTIDFTPEK